VTKYSIVIPTFNRAGELRGTLASLAAIRCADAWEVIVVDNNCTDDTPAVVRGAAVTFPVALKYVFEKLPGRCAAMNAGIAQAGGTILVTVDDDVRVAPDYLDQVGAAFASLKCDYIGGRVHPLWQGKRPSWLPKHRTRHWAVIALLDQGMQPFEWTNVLPLGCNMAFTRHAFEVTGPWNNDVGRKAGTLLGQEVREWCLRARDHGLRGYYAPNVLVQHVIHASRLNKAYFRRWFYWRGISRAIMYQQHGFDMENPQARGRDFSKIPHVAGMPRYLLKTAVKTAGRMVRETLRRNETSAFEYELLLCMFVGIAAQRWKDRRQPFAWGHRARGRNISPEPVVPPAS
jgi:glucosyl-dolichyl phosphate glucuronosyltransferase